MSKFKIQSTLKFLSKIFLLLTILLLSKRGLFAQCATPTDGQNLITNGDFESGVVGFTSGYTQHCLSAAGVGRDAQATGYSLSGEYCVGDDIHQDFHCCLPGDKPFNAIPSAFADHTSGAGNNALLVDGACTAGIPVWSQVVTVQPSTNYYFTAWVVSLYTAGNYADLRFMINGVQQGTAITGPNNSTTWLNYTQVWSSGAVGGPITISIVNNNTDCSAGNDFAIDDISFTAGCAFGSPGPVPSINSGSATATLCGGGGLLNSGVSGATLEFIWKKNGTVISGATAATYNATTTGTYEVCVRESSPPSCYRSDNIVVTNTYSINLGPDLTLCNPPSVTLDAGHQGTGVTYVWERNGVVIPAATSRTYLAAQAGTYRVTVTDPSCGTQTDDVIVSSNNTAVPNNKFFCPNASVSLSVTGSGQYKWWTASAGGTAVGKGPTYTTAVLSTTTTYYVEDTSTTNYFVGPDRGDIGGGVGSNEDRRDNGYGSGGTGDYFQEFETFKPNVKINSAIVYAYCNAFPNCSGSVRMTIYNTSGTQVYQSAPFSFSSITQNAYTAFTVPINITIATPGVYRATIDGSTTGGSVYYLIKTNMAPVACNYTAFNIPNAFQFNTVRPSWMTCPFGYFFKWNISAPGDCGRVPVQAIADCTLPVDLLSFDGEQKNNNEIELHWITASEVDNDYFIVERSVDGGKTFDQVASVKASGSLAGVYSFIDRSAGRGMFYYRLRQVDVDGKSNVSHWITIDKSPGISIYPNPARDAIYIDAKYAEAKKYSVVIYNVVGEELYRTEGELSVDNPQSVDIRKLLPSVYYIQVSSGDEKWVDKFVKE